MSLSSVVCSEVFTDFTNFLFVKKMLTYKLICDVRHTTWAQLEGLKQYAPPNILLAPPNNIILYSSV